MRLIDADKISRLRLTIVISERTGDVLKGHARGKEEVIRRAIDVFNQVLLQAPTVDQWHYPSKGEYPTENGKYLVDWRGEYGEHIDIDQWSDGKWLYIGEVIAWQYIIPPKEEE